MEIIGKSEVTWSNTDESGKDIFMINTVSGEILLIKNELNISEEIETMYFCDSSEENYKLLLEAGFKDINNCGKYLDKNHHIRFYIDSRKLHWERVGSFCVNNKSRLVKFRHIDTRALKDLINIIKGLKNGK